jgi:two-component system, NarL family, sensor histidine kinase UhpB
VTPAAKSRRKSTPSREELYRAALGEYLSDGSEVTRGQAYDLGRAFLKDGVSLVELATIHHSALGKILRLDSSRTTNDDLFRAAEFLSESLSSYEMAHRGFQEAVSALRRMNEVLEEEIKRIAYAVHDEAGQLLVAVHLALADVAREAPDSRRNIDNISDLLKKVEVQLRQFSHELRPTILDDLGLVPAIRFLAGAVSKRSNLPIHVSAEIPARLSSCAEIAVYRVVQEALTNVVKHAQARSVSVEIIEEDSTVHCIIQDDGVGFSPESVQQAGKRKGLGLVAMQERLNAIGGIIQFESAPTRGTTIRLSLPDAR